MTRRALVLLALFLIAAPVRADQTPQTHHVLIIHSYTTRNRYTRLQDQAIRAGLAREHPAPLTFDTIELDYDHAVADESGWLPMSVYLQSRYRGRPLDLIITTDTPALHFLERYAASVFRGVPVVVSAPLAPPSETLREVSPVTGIIERVDVEGTLRLIRTLFPERSRILVVTNESPYGRFLNDLTHAAAASEAGDGLRLEWLIDKEFDALLARTSRADRGEAILFLTYWDPTAHRFSYEETLRPIAEGASAPVFALYDAYIGYGVLGGTMASAEWYGRTAAILAARVLRGEDAASIPLIQSVPNPVIIDARALRRWGVPESALPPGATVLFRADSLLRQHWRPLLAVAAVVVLQGGVIGALVVARSRQRRAEAAVRAGAEQFRALAENVPGIVYRSVSTQDGRRWFEYAGPGMERILGPSIAAGARADMNDYFALVSPEDYDRIQAEARRCIAEGGTFDCTYRVRTEGGEQRWIRSVASHRRRPDGSVEWNGILLDIDRTYRAEESLRRHEAILRAVAQAGNLLARGERFEHTTRPALSILGAAAGVERAYLFRVEEHGARTLAREVAEWCADGIPSQFNDPRYALIDTADWDGRRWIGPLSRGEAISRVVDECPEPERTYFREQGLRSLVIVPVFAEGRWWGFLGLESLHEPRRWTEAELDALRTAANAVASAVERSRRDARLRETEARFRAITENTREVLWTSNADNSAIDYISPAFDEIWGIPARRIIDDASAFLETIHPEDREGVARAIAAIHKGYDIVFRIVRPDGAVRWIRDRAYPIHGPDGAVSRIVGVADDITETKRAETVLRRNNQLQQLLLSELDHRVKNSLAGLLTLIDLSASDQPTVEEFARSMRDRVAALASAHALLSDAHWQPVGIRAMLSRLMPPGTPGAFDLAGPEAMIPARQATALAMIFQELITNSIKHGAASSPAGRTVVSWSVSDRAQYPFASTLTVDWTERGGPPAPDKPTPRIGSRLIDGFTQFELSGSVERRFTPQGAGYRFTFQLDPVPEPPDPPSAAPAPIPASVATE